MYYVYIYTLYIYMHIIFVYIYTYIYTFLVAMVDILGGTPRLAEAKSKKHGRTVTMLTDMRLDAASGWDADEFHMGSIWFPHNGMVPNIKDL
jgi:hypothetical protein